MNSLLCFDLWHEISHLLSILLQIILGFVDILTMSFLLLSAVGI